MTVLGTCLRKFWVTDVQVATAAPPGMGPNRIRIERLHPLQGKAFRDGGRSDRRHPMGARIAKPLVVVVSMAGGHFVHGSPVPLVAG
jgi:hypothetical protein